MIETRKSFESKKSSLRGHNLENQFLDLASRNKLRPNNSPIIELWRSRLIGGMTKMVFFNKPCRTSQSVSQRVPGRLDGNRKITTAALADESICSFQCCSVTIGQGQSVRRGNPTPRVERNFHYLGQQPFEVLYFVFRFARIIPGAD